MCIMELVSYGLETVFRMQLCLIETLFGFLHVNFVYTGNGTFSQATPGLLNTYVTGYNEFARN